MAQAVESHAQTNLGHLNFPTQKKVYSYTHQSLMCLSSQSSILVLCIFPYLLLSLISVSNAHRLRFRHADRKPRVPSRFFLCIMFVLNRFKQYRSAISSSSKAIEVSLPVSAHNPLSTKKIFCILLSPLCDLAGTGRFLLLVTVKI